MNATSTLLVCASSLSSPLWLLLELLGMLAVIALFGFVFLRLLGKLASRADSSAIRVLARRTVEPRRSLMVVEVGHRAWLVASSEAGMNCLAELDDEALQELRASSTPSRPRLPRLSWLSSPTSLARNSRSSAQSEAPVAAPQAEQTTPSKAATPLREEQKP